MHGGEGRGKLQKLSVKVAEIGHGKCLGEGKIGGKGEDVQPPDTRYPRTVNRHCRN